ncbi:hypothetical protein [Marinomonas sp.]|uniref:capsular polysaccharide export protein, LipB/KpsS family n=1 Tax=Marinomonas sp. TaxID=1904862 RepID=UPI003A9119D4
MDYLFISRKNVHSRYYQILVKRLKLDCELYITGMPTLSSLLFLKEACKVDFSGVLEQQTKRKKAYHPIWKNTLLMSLYRRVQLGVERLRYAKFLSVLSVKKPSHVVIWNGRKLPNVTIAMAAKSLGIKVFYFENGLLPQTVTLDPKGVNFSSSLSQDPSFYLSFDPENKHAFSAPDIVPRSNIKKRQRFQSADLPDRFIFVPFQVPHDTQIVCYSSWIESMEMLYDQVISSVKALNDPELKVVFKEHPSWHKHYSSLYNKDSIGQFANGNSTVELMSKAEAVVTINSTVGMESLLLNQRVITLGDACYNIDGLVLHANTASQLTECLLQIQQGWQMNTQLCEKYFSYLEYVYCIPRIAKDDPEHIEAVRQRLLEEDVFSRTQNGVSTSLSRSQMPTGALELSRA